MRDSSDKPISVEKYELVNTDDSSKKAKHYITNNDADLRFNFDFYGLQESKLTVTAERKGSDLYNKLVDEEKLGAMNNADYYNNHTASMGNYIYMELENKFNLILYGNLIINKYEGSKILFDDIYRSDWWWY